MEHQGRRHRHHLQGREKVAMVESLHLYPIFTDAAETVDTEEAPTE